MPATLTPRHAAPEASPYTYAAHYVFPDFGGCPLVLLEEDPMDTPYPTGYGVRLYPGGLGLPPGAAAEPCTECGAHGPDCTVQVDTSGGGNPAYDQPYHLACLLGGAHLGVVPAWCTEPIPYA